MDLVVLGLVVGAVLGIVALALSRRRTVPASTIREIQKSGIAMPAASEKRTLELYTAVTRWTGVVVLATIALSTLVGLLLAPILGDIPVVVVGAFLVAMAPGAGLYYGAARDARSRASDPTLTRDLRQLRLKDFHSRKFRAVSRIGSVVSIASWAVVALLPVLPSGDDDLDSASSLVTIAVFAFVIGFAISNEIFVPRVAALPIASSNLAELSWEDAQRWSVTRRGIVATTQPALVIVAAASSMSASREFVLAGSAIPLAGLLFYIAVGAYLLFARERQPYLLTRLWPQVAAARAASRTPERPAVVSP